MLRIHASHGFAIERLLVAALRDPGLREVLNALPGYDPAIAGVVTPLREAFPTLADLQ